VAEPQKATASSLEGLQSKLPTISHAMNVRKYCFGPHFHMFERSQQGIDSDAILTRRNNYKTDTYGLLFDYKSFPRCIVTGIV
jgi:hypothetical protein